MSDNDDAIDKIINLIKEATRQVEDTGTKVILVYDDESVIYGIGSKINERRDVHAKIIVEPAE
jgi:fructoselysine-6-P-deglycase FrlB-like protein